MTAAPRILVVDLHRKESFYRELLPRVAADWTPVTPPALLLGPPPCTDLVIVDDETWAHTAAAIPELRRRAIPTLHLVDGIIEWRNTWENPRSQTEEAGMPHFQPVLSDKIACLGPAHARVLESWGNVGRCEITGSPRFDALAGLRARTRPRGSEARILVATARKPAFSAMQRERVRQSLSDVARWFAGSTSLATPVFRLTDGLGPEIGVESRAEEVPLPVELASVDALVTTPSTIMLEAMAVGLPVALLDYTNRPQYVPAAWSITAPGHVAEVLADLLVPPRERMRYQDMILHDQLRLDVPASVKVGELIARMVAIGREARANGWPLVLPPRILDDPPGARRFPLEELHPRHPIYACRDLAVLQAEVAHLRRAIRQGPAQALYRVLCDLPIAVAGAKKTLARCLR